jgi:hypothetical protein
MHLTESNVPIEICNRSNYLSPSCGIKRFEALLADLKRNGWNAYFANWEDEIGEKPALPIFEEYNGHCTSAAGDFNFIDEGGFLLSYIDDGKLQELFEFCDRHGFKVIDADGISGIVSKDFDLESLS